MAASVSNTEQASGQSGRRHVQRQGRRTPLYQRRRKPASPENAAARALCSSARNGRIIRDAKTLARLRALVLPPAWTDVWISTDPRAHLQATGRDAAGRKQYRYHAHWRSERDSTKYHRLLAFAEVLPRDSPPHPARPDGAGVLPSARPRHRRRIARAHLHPHRQRRIRAQAQVARLDDAAGSAREDPRTQAEVRVSRQERRLSIDRDRGAAPREGGARMPGPSGPDAVSIPRRSAQGEEPVVDRHQRLPARGHRRNSSPPRTIAPGRARWPPRRRSTRWSRRPRRPRPIASIVKAIDQVAEVLGNTRAVCRGSYIHPAVIDAFRDGITLSSVQASRNADGAARREARLVALLRRAGRTRKAA